MNRTFKGCGCAVAVLAVILGAAGFAGWRYVLPWWRTQPPPASGGELRVHILDVGPVNGDSILIISPSGTTVLLDAGDTGKGKIVLEALKRYNVQQLDYFIATHPHPDHIGAADEVMKGTKVLNVIDNGLEPTFPASAARAKPTPTPSPKPGAKRPPDRRPASLKFFDEYKEAMQQSGARYEKAEPGTKLELGGGARLTLLGPIPPSFTKEQMKTGGNEPNANSVVARLDYGSFSMLLTGDAEEQSEHRLLTKDLDLQADIIKIAHHGSKYASSAAFLERVKPKAAIISCGEWNRYGHPAQVVLDRLKAANVKVSRTDLEGEITITTKGRENDYKVSAAKQTKDDIWIGRTAQKDDSSRVGFIAYGDFGPPPKVKGSAR